MMTPLTETLMLLVMVVNLSLAGVVAEMVSTSVISTSNTLSGESCPNTPEHCSCSMNRLDNPSNIALYIMCQTKVSDRALKKLFLGIKDNVTQVQFRESHLKNVPKQFCILKRLTHLDLSRNDIRLSRKSLGCLKQLSILNLARNDIECLKNFTFRGLKQLRELYLGFNKIHFIDTAVFNDDLKSLWLIDMQHNYLREIDTWVFRLPNAVKRGYKVVLNLTNNLLETFTNHIDWSINEAEIGHEVLINFQYNNLGRVGELIKFLKRIHVDVDNLFMMFSQLRRLWDMGFDVRYNKLYCDCDMYEVTKLAKLFIPMFNHTMVEFYINIHCYYPKNLRGVLFYEVPDDMFQCDIKRDCPKSCSCIHTPNNKTNRLECHAMKHLPERVPRDEHIELRLAKGTIEEPEPKPYLKNVTVFDVADNKITSVKASLIHYLLKSKNVRILLEMNQIEYLPEKAWKEINSTNVLEVSIGQNPLQCDCKSLWLKHWLQKNKGIVSDIMTIQCHNDPVKGKTIIEVDDADFFCVNWSLTILQLGITSALVITAFIGVAFALADDRRMTPIQTFFDNNLKFDIFLSFCDKDRLWVKKYLIDKLMYEDGHLSGGYGACGSAPEHEPDKWYYIAFADKDFVHGQPITQNITNCIATSRVTLMVISKNFLQSNWCKYEFRSAHNNALSRKGVKLIAIKCGDVTGVPIETDLEMHLKSHTYLDKNEPDFYAKLRRALPVPLYTRLKEDVEDAAKSIRESSPVVEHDELNGVYDYGTVEAQQADKDYCYSPVFCHYNPRRANRQHSIN